MLGCLGERFQFRAVALNLVNGYQDARPMGFLSHLSQTFATFASFRIFRELGGNGSTWCIRM